MAGHGQIIPQVHLHHTRSFILRLPSLVNHNQKSVSFFFFLATEEITQR